MHVVSVAPLTRSVPGSELTYYSKEKLSVNTLVSVPLGRQTLMALVITSRPLKEAKSAIRGGTFELKKVDQVLARPFFSEAFFRATMETAYDHALPVADILRTLTPKFFLERSRELPPQVSEPVRENAEASRPPSKLKESLLETSADKRFNIYQKQIHETLEMGQSVFILTADRASGEQLKAWLEKRFSDRVRFLHSARSQKKLEKEIPLASTSSSPAVFIGTSPFLCVVPEKMLGLLIIEELSNPAHRSQRPPWVDGRNFARHFASHAKIPVLSGAKILSVEEATRTADAVEKHPDSQTTLTLPETSVVDMSKYRRDEDGFQVFSSPVWEQLERTLARGQKAMVFTVRRDLASMVLCRDCQRIVFCPHCDKPLSLGERKSGRFFACRKCGFKQQMDSSKVLLCSHCGGFRLEGFGLGVDKVREILSEQFPDIPIFQIDGNHTKTHPSARKVAEAYEEVTEGPAIILGTRKMLDYVHSSNPPAISVVASLDSLFALPDFRINERIFALLAEIAECTDDALFIQTRNPEAEVFAQFQHADIVAFREQELSGRRAFAFPPSRRLIKISAMSQPDESARQSLECKLAEFFSNYEPDIYPAFASRVKNRYIVNALIRFDPDVGMSDDLRARLRSLPDGWSFQVDPEDIL